MGEAAWGQDRPRWVAFEVLYPAAEDEEETATVRRRHLRKTRRNPDARLDAVDREASCRRALSGSWSGHWSGLRRQRHCPAQSWLRPEKAW